MTAAERALLFAAFSAALGFGTLIPLLPAYLGAVGGAAWHAGAVPVVFLACASLAAPFLLLALPGFEWLTVKGFAIGLAKSFLYRALLGLVYVPIYNTLARRFGSER